MTSVALCPPLTPAHPCKDYGEWLLGRKFTKGKEVAAARLYFQIRWCQDNKVPVVDDAMLVGFGKKHMKHSVGKVFAEDKEYCDWALGHCDITKGGQERKSSQRAAMYYWARAKLAESFPHAAAPADAPSPSPSRNRSAETGVKPE